jgi:hypothetical protein
VDNFSLSGFDLAIIKDDPMRAADTIIATLIKIKIGR